MERQQVVDSTDSDLSVCFNTRGVFGEENDDGYGSTRQGDDAAPKNVCKVDIEHRCRGYYLSHAGQVGMHIWHWVLSAIIYDFLQDLKALRPAL